MQGVTVALLHESMDHTEKISVGLLRHADGHGIWVHIKANDRQGRTKDLLWFIMGDSQLIKQQKEGGEAFLVGHRKACHLQGSKKNSHQHRYRYPGCIA